MAVATSAVILGFLVSSGVASAAAEDGPPAFTSTPAPTISTVPIVGTATSVSFTAWSPQPDDVEVQWFENGTPIPGANDDFYTPVPSDRGATLTVAETGSLGGTTFLTVTSPGSQLVLGLPTTTGVTISGGAKPGDVVSSDVGSWIPANVALEYVWIVGSRVREGAVDPTYTTTEDDAGLQIWLQVAASSDGWSRTLFRSNTITVGADHIAAGSVTVSGQPIVGQTLTSMLYNWRPIPTVVEHQWLRDGVAIPDATASTYVIQPGDATHALSVIATGEVDGLPSVSVTSLRTASVTLAFVSTPPPVISGTFRLGDPLTAAVPNWTPTATHYTYHWYLDGREQTLLSGPSVVFSDPADVGKSVSVQVVGASPTSGPATATSAVSPPIAPGVADLSHVVIGIVHLNAVVTPNMSGVPATAPIAYQWTLDGVDIPGANGPTYLPQPNDYAKKLRVTASVAGGATGYAPSTGTSNAETVNVGHLSEGGTIITGVARVGNTLTAASVGWGVPGVHVKYEWYTWNDPFTILSTTNTYTLRPSDLGQTVLAMSQASLTHYVTSDGWIGNDTGPVARGLFATAPAATVTGSMSVGATLTAHHTTAQPSSGVTYRYQWYSQTSASATPIAISRATSATYKVPAAQARHILTVRVAASKLAYVSIVSSSSSTVSVLGQRPLPPRVR
jgi:hypothetical protein